MIADIGVESGRFLEGPERLQRDAGRRSYGWFDRTDGRVNSLLGLIPRYLVIYGDTESSGERTGSVLFGTEWGLYGIWIFGLCIGIGSWP